MRRQPKGQGGAVALDINRLSFTRLVREIFQSFEEERGASFKLSSEALIGLQAASEHYLAALMVDADLARAHANRAALEPEDVRLVALVRKRAGDTSLYGWEEQRIDLKKLRAQMRLDGLAKRQKLALRRVAQEKEAQEKATPKRKKLTQKRGERRTRQAPLPEPTEEPIPIGAAGQETSS